MTKKVFSYVIVSEKLLLDFIVGIRQLLILLDEISFAMWILLK